jgi:glucose-1-phosphate cytidylyltransferase
MKAVILAGGLGSRITEESHLRPKPMVEVGGKPLLWHILKLYSTHGIQEFVICCGYKGYVIKEYFANYFLHMTDMTIDMTHNDIEVHHRRAEPWKITLVDTGLDTLTGGRLKRVKDYVNDETFCLTYGDGVSNVNIPELIEFHKKNKRLATVTAVQPPARFGAMRFKGDLVSEFEEKPKGDDRWINGGFFVLEPGVMDYIPGDSTSWEYDSLKEIASAGELAAYRHTGFWAAMDTLRDKNHLESLWAKGEAPWKLWHDK